MSTITLLMALYPDIQEKLVNELQNVFLTSDEDVTEYHVNQLTYMEFFIKESLRLYPVLPHIDRLLTEDMMLGKHKVFCDMKTI
jgi:cytochrome P450